MIMNASYKKASTYNYEARGANVRRGNGAVRSHNDARTCNLPFCSPFISNRDCVDCMITRSIDSITYVVIINSRVTATLICFIFRAVFTFTGMGQFLPAIYVI